MGNAKPRLFIGSSVEGLNVAYAAQQNLKHSAEITVWDQGVFNLSVSALDSLLHILNTCDFGMFVFSPDDILNIRGNENQAIRDNVIFELGLFVGKLGKERCFILIPDKNNEIRIPTDLIGMTPATYETGRSDNSYQAATGAACHMIRTEINNKGHFNYQNQTSNVKSESTEVSPGNLIEKKIEKENDSSNKTPSGNNAVQDNQWLEAYIENKFDDCIKLLDIKISLEKTESELADLESWKGRAIFSKDNELGISYLKDVISKYPSYDSPYVHLVYGLMDEYEYETCLEIVDLGIDAVKEPTTLITAKCSCLEKLGFGHQIEEVLRKYILIHPKIATLAILLSDSYLEQNNYDMARTTLETALKINKTNKELTEKYARFLYNQNEAKQALIQYNKLVNIDSSNSEYLTLRANIFLQLDLNDLAMRDYKEANEIAQNKQGWILGNIGNLYNSKGFYHEAVSYLKKAIELNPDSEYAHNRLSEAIKKRDEEKKKLDNILKEAQRVIAHSIQAKTTTEVISLEPSYPQLT